jgi:NADPH:quinone reductase-like Zn-dependent oxidoreductase
MKRSDKMKAIICTKYGPPEVLQLTEVDKPVPKNNQICIKNFATAVTASDCIIRGFNIPFWHPMGFMMGLVIGFGKPRQPILGIVFSGEVDSIGRDVRTFRKGDKVFGWDLFPGFGAYAQYKCIAENKMVAIKPENMNFEEAAALPYGGLLAMSLIKRADINNGKKVLVYGASGAIGTSVVQLAKHFGCYVTGICSTANLELVKSLGADTVMDYNKENAVNNGMSYDVIIDAVGKKKTSKLKQESIKALSPGGRYISIDDGAPKTGITDLKLLKELAEKGRLKPVIDRVYPLEQIAEAHAYADKGHKKGNVIITIGQD